MIVRVDEVVLVLISLAVSVRLFSRRVLVRASAVESLERLLGLRYKRQGVFDILGNAAVLQQADQLVEYLMRF
jgi:hypothetical protein